VLKHRVFVTNYAGHDYTQAEQFGKIVFVTKGFVSFESLDRLKFMVTESLLDTTPDDYILLSGTTLICSLVVSIWLHMHKVAHILNWDKKTSDYRLLTLTTEHLDKIIEVFRSTSAEAT